jgi:hypothetical protein
MTRRTFYKKFKDSRNKISWIVNNLGQIRSLNNGFCPITGVAYYLGCGLFNISQYEEAGEKLGLSVENILKIVDASDGVGNENIYRSLINKLKK